MIYYFKSRMAPGFWVMHGHYSLTVYAVVDDYGNLVATDGYGVFRISEEEGKV
jgi:hypothetical protein